jgi:hypothetical protein
MKRLAMHRTKRWTASLAKQNGRKQERASETRDSSKFLAAVDESGSLQANSALRKRQKQGK